MKFLTRTVTYARFRPATGYATFKRSFVTHPPNILLSQGSSFSRVSSPERPNRTREYSPRETSDQQGQEPTSSPDPSRADLFYHLVQASPNSYPSFAVSFLPSPPSSSESDTIIGWLPADEGAGLNDFKENPKFRTILHEAIKAGLREDVDEVQRNGAIQYHSGWMHIHDNRNVPALGRIGDVDDIIATVLVEEGKILPETYQIMPAYRLVTADGVTQLTPGLAEKLKSVLEERAAQEKK
ncbi:hypothetical protein E1B28_006578 [Marasmius oreades]|uniref:Uncharacterized protein n=1 Tax=Marasmius oreades TaxID=181124 RepID=A0A9P7S6M2_9AGAR|nr:uncharacterized protein E1B28_006578 [Marasmius oreades]KAG7095890.1 hypothetical protein E1B28_006578 [Marasmius oreades]